MFQAVLLVLTIALLYLLIIGLMHRYQKVNLFYLDYEAGHFVKAKETFWDSESVSISDLKKAGVKNASVNSGSSFYQSFDPIIEGHTYYISDDYKGFFSVVELSKTNRNKELMLFFKSNDKPHFVSKSERRNSQSSRYRKNTVSFVNNAEKKTYQYWKRHGALRYLKMLPLYEYFRK